MVFIGLCKLEFYWWCDSIIISSQHLTVRAGLADGVNMLII